MKDDIEQLVLSYKDLSPKPILIQFIKNYKMSDSLKRNLLEKNCKLRKKFDNIVNQIKRENICDNKENLIIKD